MTISFARYYWETFVKPNRNYLTWDEISKNSNIHFELFMENRDEFPWDYKSLVSNKNINENHILLHQNINQDWCIENAITNPNISLDFILKNINQYKWQLENYFDNPAVCLEEVLEKIPQILDSYNVFFLHQDMKFSPKTLLAYPNYHWNLRDICKSKFLDIDFIMNNFHQFDWNISALSENPNITIDHIQELSKYKWNLTNFSKNPSVTKNIVLDNPDFDWEINGLFLNPNLCFADILEIIEEIPNLSCDEFQLKLQYYSLYIHNKNIQMREISNHFLYRYSKVISQKLFLKDQELFNHDLNRCLENTKKMTEELIQTVFHPKRLQTLLDCSENKNEVIEYWTT